MDKRILPIRCFYRSLSFSHRIFTLFSLANDWKGLTFIIGLFYKGTRCPPDVIDVIRYLMITSVAFWLLFGWSRMEGIIDFL